MNQIITIGKFDFIPLLLTTGAGIGLLALPTIIADFILLNCTQKRKSYRKLKETVAPNSSYNKELSKKPKNNIPHKYQNHENHKRDEDSFTNVNNYKIGTTHNNNKSLHLNCKNNKNNL